MTDEQKALDRAAEKFLKDQGCENWYQLRSREYLTLSGLFSAGHASRDAEVKALKEKLESALPDWDCGSNSCRFAKVKGGMRTNGPCTCARHLQTPERIAFMRMYAAIKSVLTPEAVANEEGRDG